LSALRPSSTSRNEALNQIWGAYIRDRELVHRNELIVAYQPLVNATVQRMPAYILAYWESDELRSFGQDGLLRAITRWSDVDTSKFEQYAQRCIRGAIFDELRRLDWMPRSIRRRLVVYKTTYDLLIGELGRNPRPEEVCSAMGLTERQTAELMSELDASQLLHLEGRAGQSFGSSSFVDVLADDQAGPEGELLASADVEALHRAMSKLAEREHTVLFLAFVGGLTQDQIGKIIGVGGPQVSKIQSTALRRLRTILMTNQADSLATTGSPSLSQARWQRTG
jgi:RNA polymerase sigma factor for flagellar operon FliA